MGMVVFEFKLVILALDARISSQGVVSERDPRIKSEGDENPGKILDHVPH